MKKNKSRCQIDYTIVLFKKKKKICFVTNKVDDKMIA